MLSFGLEGADALHLVAEEVDAVGVFGGEGEDVDDAAAQGVLSGFVDVVDALEAVAVEDFGDEGHVYPFMSVELQGLVGQFGTGDDFLGQRVGIGDDAEGSAGLLQAAQHLGAQYLVGGVLLSVLDGSAEGGGEEEHVVVAQHLHEVVVEVACLFQVAQYEGIGAVALPDENRGEQGGGRGAQAPAIEVTDGGVAEDTADGRHVGVGGVALLQFAQGHSYSL